MGLPVQVSYVLFTIYLDVYHHIRLIGVLYDGFSISTGIAQGGPLSTILFVVVLNPFLRMVVTKIPRNPRHPVTTQVGS